MGRSHVARHGDQAADYSPACHRNTAELCGANIGSHSGDHSTRHTHTGVSAAATVIVLLCSCAATSVWDNTTNFILLEIHSDPTAGTGENVTRTQVRELHKH